MDEPRLKPRLKPDTGMSPDSTLSTDIGMSPNSSIIKPGNDIDEMFEACRLDEVFQLTNEENHDLLQLNAELENMLDLQVCIQHMYIICMYNYMYICMFLECLTQKHGSMNC